MIGRACELGGVRVLVTNPEWAPTLYSIDQQKALAAHGNGMFARCFVSTAHLGGSVPFETVLSTGLGLEGT